MADNVGSVNKQKPYHRENLRTRLIDDAVAMLEADGIEALSLRELARRAGVSPMAPYRHFADRAALLDAVTLRGFEELGATLVRLDAECGEDARKALIEQGLAYVEFAAARPHLFRLMFGRPPTWQAGEEVDRPGTAFHRFMNRIRALVPPDEVEPAALAAHALVRGLASLVNEGRLRPGQGGPDRMRAALALMVGRLAPARPDAEGKR